LGDPLSAFSGESGLPRRKIRAGNEQITARRARKSKSFPAFLHLIAIEDPEQTSAFVSASSSANSVSPSAYAGSTRDRADSGNVRERAGGCATEQTNDDNSLRASAEHVAIHRSASVQLSIRVRPELTVSEGPAHEQRMRAMAATAAVTSQKPPARSCPGGAMPHDALGASTEPPVADAAPEDGKAALARPCIVPSMPQAPGELRSICRSGAEDTCDTGATQAAAEIPPDTFTADTVRPLHDCQLSTVGAVQARGSSTITAILLSSFWEPPEGAGTPPWRAGDAACTTGSGAADAAMVHLGCPRHLHPVLLLCRSF
jgi:hypothetical protein